MDDFGGKTLVPFCTSGGSGIGSSGENLQKLTKAAKVLPGQRFSGRVSADELKRWAASLNI